MKHIYKLFTYDIWGNKKDGFEVNDVFNTGHTFTVEDNLTHKEFLKELAKLFYGTASWAMSHNKCTIEGESDYTLYITSNLVKHGGMKPLCELRYFDCIEDNQAC